MNGDQFGFRRGVNLAQRFLQSAVIWMWAVTALRLANFLIVLPIALRILPSETVGLWYLMLNLVGMIALVEFGLSAAIARQATFFFAGAGLTETDLARGGNDPNWSAIHGLIGVAERIYSWLGWLVVAGCVGGGLWLGLAHPKEMLQPGPVIAFLLLSVATFIRMRGLFWNPLLFGLERVRASQHIQFTAIILSYAVTLCGLLLGGKLVALAAGQAVMLLYLPYRSRWMVKKTAPQIFHAPATRPPWRPIWSSTWKSGAVFFGSWIGTQGLVFASAQTAGLSISASFSLSSLVAFTIHSAAQSWLLARYPTISALWAGGKRSEIGTLAKKRIALAMATFAVAALCAWVTLPELIQLIGSRTPALPRPQLGLLFVMAGVDLFIGLNAAVLTSCNVFPHLRVMVGAGIATAISAFVLGSRFGLWGILIAPIACQALSALWIVPSQLWALVHSREKPTR